MRYVMGIALLATVSPAIANDLSSPEEVLKKAQQSFRTAKNPEEVASIKMWCKDMISTFSFKEREKLMLQGIKLLEVNKIDEANAAFKRVNSLDELDTNLGTMACKPQ